MSRVPKTLFSGYKNKFLIPQKHFDRGESSARVIEEDCVIRTNKKNAILFVGKQRDIEVDGGRWTIQRQQEARDLVSPYDTITRQIMVGELWTLRISIEENIDFPFLSDCREIHLSVNNLYLIATDCYLSESGSEIGLGGDVFFDHVFMCGNVKQHSNI